jgi:hypothetical protein
MNRGKEWDRSMFSDDVAPASRVGWPQNVSVPASPVNGYNPL